MMFIPYTPYTKEPPLAKFGQRLALHLFYLATLAVGVLSLFVLSFPFAGFPGAVMILGSIIALIGVVRGKYRLEFVSLPFLIGACLVLAVLLNSHTIGLSIILLIAVSAFLSNRFIILFLVAKALREDNEQEK